MTAPMPETMSPREKVAEIVMDAVGDYLIRQYGKSYGLHHPIDRARIIEALPHDAILAALASSGDHAELARLAEAAKRVRRDAVGRLDGDDAVRIWAAFHDAANPATVLALIAEVAALREQVKIEKRVAKRSDDCWQEAERKLAEAVGLLRECLTWARKFPDLWGRISTFLSKEAERG